MLHQLQECAAAYASGYAALSIAWCQLFGLPLYAAAKRAAPPIKRWSGLTPAEQDEARARWNEPAPRPTFAERRRLVAFAR
jgi:hypothetical protein